MVGVLWAAVITLIVDAAISLFTSVYLRWYPRVA
jgi:ABC-type phosphate transport system permease subunit